MDENIEVQGASRNREFSRFMASPAGRMSRAVAGGALIGAGLARGGRGYLLALVGLVPLMCGALDVCLISALMGGPFWGEDARSEI